MIKTYSELITLPTFEERFEYLRLNSKVGVPTFGSSRYLNQRFYSTDEEWLAVRDEIIIRDNGCDLGCEGFDITFGITVHHIVPITVEDIINRTKRLFDRENLISTSSWTHKAIHYGDKSLLLLPPVARFKHDTCPWKK